MKGFMKLTFRHSYISDIFLSDYEMDRRQLRFISIHFGTSTFDRITKDRASKFENILSAIGGTMGLLTGFSLISAVEIVYFTIKIFIKSLRKLAPK